MSTPMVMKKGTAISEKELMPLTICMQTVVSGSPCAFRQMIDEIATA